VGKASAEALHVMAAIANDNRLKGSLVSFVHSARLFIIVAPFVIMPFYGKQQYL